MTRKLYLHIGLRKAGSTSIQLALDRMAARLGAAGVWVPVAGRWRGNHNDLVSDLIGRAPRSGQTGDPWVALAKEIRYRRDLAFVVSAETLGGEWGAQGASRAAELAEATGLDVEVIVYVRPQWQTLESLYSERARKGWVSKPFDTFVADIAASGWLDFNEALRPWRQLFSAVRVTPLESLRMPDGLVAHFFTMLGLRDAYLLRGARTRSNLRMGAKRLEVLRLVGAACPSMDHWERRQLVRRLAPLRSMLPKDAPFAGLNAEEIRQVMQRFAASNQKFARAYGVDRNGRLFQDPYSDDRTRPYRPVWNDFTERERRRVREFVRRSAGIDLAVVADGSRVARESGLSLIKWSVASRIALHRAFGAVKRLAGRLRSRGAYRSLAFSSGSMRENLAGLDSSASDIEAAGTIWRG